MKKVCLRLVFILAVLFSSQTNAAVVKMLLLGDTQWILNTSLGDWKTFTNAMYKVTRDTVTSNAMFLASMGDICEDADPARENNVPLSYDHAVAGFNLLNGRMPYILNFGNNDTTAEYNRVFPLSHFSSWPSFVANNDNYRNSAHKFTAGGVDWLVISIKRFPDAALVSWAEGLIDNNSSRKVIIVNHTQGLGDGDIVWNMVKRKANVVFMFLGHNTVMHEMLTANDGHKVGRIQTCWHNKSNDHYLGVVLVDTTAGTVNVSYYSPVNKNYKDVNNSTYKWSWSGFSFGGSSQMNNAAYVSQTVPASIVAGQTASVTVRMKNTGTSTWSPAEAQKLGSLGDSNTWGVTRVYLTGSVAPGKTNAFTFNITAPATAGNYSFQWRMVDDEGSNIGWFGANSALQTITVSSGAMTTVPWVTNMTVSAAGTSITNAGLVVSSVSQEYHATVAAGRIFSQTPGGNTSVARGSSVALAASLGPQPQLVLNNSFETNTASWTLTGSAARSTTTHAGSGVASLRINTTNGYASQPVTIVSGKTYDISVYAYISARTAGQVVFDTGDKYDGTGQGQFVFNAANGGWNKSSGVFTATNTSLTVRMFSEGFAGTAYFDLIELKPRN